MAFPTVQSLIVANSGTTGTTFVASLPSGLVNGDLCIIFICSDNRATGFSATGWTQRPTTLDQSGTAQKGGILYRYCNGTEGTTVTVSLGASSAIGALSTRITNALNGQIPENASTTAVGGGPAVDPPSLSPSWGAADNLWFAVGMTQTSEYATAAPTNYTGLTNSSTAATSAVIAAYRQLNASSENPGAFTTNKNNQNIAQTWAIRPSLVGVSGNFNMPMLGM